MNPGENEQLDKALVQSSKEAAKSPTAPDPVTESGIERAKLDRFEAETAGIKADNRGRTKYAQLTFRLIVWWLCGTFLIVFLQGFLHGEGSEYLLLDGSVFKIRFELTQPVLLMFLGTSTGTVVGLFATVMLYLFKTKASGPEAEGEETEEDEDETEDE